MHSKFVYFDLGNVLVHFDHAIAVRQLAQAAARTEEQVRRIVFESDLQNQYESGRVSSPQFAATINDHLGTELAEEQILDAISAIFSPNDSILCVLESLRKSGIPMGLLSNTCEAHWRWILDQNWPIPGDWFDFHVLSYEVRSMKPGEAIYEACEKLAARASEEIFFTDDREENIAAAQRRGWETHLYRTPAQLAEHLNHWLTQGS